MPARRRRMVTIKELAKRLNLSTTTVSNVIHGKTKEVSPSTIERVQKALIEYDYIPNINARNLAQNKSKIIGVAMKAREDKSTNLFSDPFIAEMVGGIEKIIRTSGYFMMIYVSHDLKEIMKQVSTWNVDGLIAFGIGDDATGMIRERYKKPIVCIDGYLTGEHPGIVNIGLEDEKGAYNAVSHLIENGHRKIAFLSDAVDIVDRERLKGFQKAVEDAGIVYKDEDFLRLNPWKDKIEASLDEISNRLKDYTAVFCVSDLYAVQLMTFLNNRGVHVPEDISVVGFDDNLLGKIFRPSLTTIHQDAEKKGTLAAETLISMLNGKEVPKNIVLETNLVVRHTVRNIGEED